MAPRKHVGTRMDLLQQRCTGGLLCVLSLEAAGTLALMIYALWYEVGNLVDLPEKRIGFYNFCLWNETAGERQCLDSKHLEMMGISLLKWNVATFCVYTCLVFSLFYFLFVVTVKCTEQEQEWKMIFIFLISQMVILSGGLIMFLLQTSQWIQPSDFTGGFWALLGTLALLLLQIITSTMYRSWAKHTHKTL